MKKIYDSPKWRAGVSALLTVIVSILLSLLGNWDSGQRLFGWKLAGFIVAAFLDLSYVVLCAAQDSKEHSLIAALKNENTVYKKAMSGTILVSQENATQINECMHEYAVNRQINPYVWSYKKACYSLCAIIYQFVTQLTNNDNVEVSYVKLNEDIPGEITLFAYKNQTNQAPNLLNIPRNFLSTTAIPYFDMKMFKKNCSDTVVLCGSSSINNNFYRTTDELERHPKKYNQFIAIPVFCNNEKMIGLLQIACLDKSSLDNNKDMIEEISNKFLVPYANLFLLLHKMNKALHLGI